MDTENKVNQHLRSYFQNLFRSDGERDMEYALSVLEPHISPEMNASLVRRVTIEEIELAASQLGVKSPRA